ncbi:hypothetical protein ABG067_001390 [Albugo candida]
MKWLLTPIVHGIRKVRHTLSPRICSICLDILPLLHYTDSSSITDAFVKLSCSHRFCLGCMQQYLSSKIQARQVEPGSLSYFLDFEEERTDRRSGQLLCPIPGCGSAIGNSDMLRIGGKEAINRYVNTLKRIHKLCSELIVCEQPGRTYSCPKCSTIACFACGERKHYLSWIFCRNKLLKSEDATYQKWERSLSKRKFGLSLVRSCPNCRIRIWKEEGCNHMSCSYCKHEFCWVCLMNWDKSMDHNFWVIVFRLFLFALCCDVQSGTAVYILQRKLTASLISPSLLRWFNVLHGFLARAYE